jgi:IS30 family transposase
MRSGLPTLSPKAEGLRPETSICIKTPYHYIDSGISAEISNKDLWVKKDGKKRNYKEIRTAALHNRKGRSITERPKGAGGRTEQGHWETNPKRITED